MTDQPSQEEIDNFFTFGQAASTGEIAQQALPLSTADQLDPALLDGSFVNAPDGFKEAVSSLPPDFYTTNLPNYFKPNIRCQYCDDLNMECKVFTNDGNKSCFSCISLFRKCSFVEANKDPAGGLDTLHTVDEDASVDWGTLTGIRPVYSSGATLETIKSEMEKRGRPKGDATTPHSTTRFSKPTVRILKTWLEQHADHPYPSNDHKEELAARTGLNGVQISNWLANARRRGKVRPARGFSPAPITGSQPVAVPAIPAGYAPADDRTPLERWKDSPPESDAPLTAIARNATASVFDLHESASSSAAQSFHDRGLLSSGNSDLSHRRAPSTTSTSLDTGRSSESIATRWSHSSSRGSHSTLYSYNSFARKDRRRKRRSTPIPSQKPPLVRRTSDGKAKEDNATRPFQCTFCVDNFKTKYDWLRHEKSLHLNLEKWICCPNGPIEPCASGHTTVCAYCRQPEPDADHIESHDHSTCIEKGINGRTFVRKDHLRQHLRLVHHVKMTEAMESWKSVPEIVRSRCGFCDANFTTWDERAAHLAKHFRDEKRMADWHGGWGFDPEVAACVADAMPPFMIDVEREKPLPWSAEKGDTYMFNDMMELHGNGPVSSLARGWEVMGAVMAEYVAQCRQRGEEITDEKLQRHARFCLYGTDDSWNQTRVDDPQWLAIFKARVGLTQSQGDVGDEAGGWSANFPLEGLPFLGADLSVTSAPPATTAIDTTMPASTSMDFLGMGTAGTSLPGGTTSALPFITAGGLEGLQGFPLPATSAADASLDAFMEDVMWPMDDDFFDMGVPAAESGQPSRDA